MVEFTLSEARGTNKTKTKHDCKVLKWPQKLQILFQCLQLRSLKQLKLKLKELMKTLMELRLKT